MQAPVAEVSKELVQKTVQEQATPAAKKDGASKFDGVLANKAGEPSFTGPGTFPSQGINLNNVQGVGVSPQSAQAKLQHYLNQGTGTAHVATANAVPSVTAKPETNRLAQTMAGIISELEKGQVHLDRLIASGLSGKELSNTEMLALQASMYKYTQEMELTGKVVEKATNGLKETLKTQV